MVGIYRSMMYLYRDPSNISVSYVCYCLIEYLFFASHFPWRYPSYLHIMTYMHAVRYAIYLLRQCCDFYEIDIVSK